MPALASLVVTRRRAVLWLGGLLVVVFAALAMTGLADYQGGGQDDPSTPSVAAANEITSQFGGQHDLVLLVTAARGAVNQGAAAQAGERLSATLAGNPELGNVVSYWSTRSAALLAQDRRSALVLAHVRGSDRVAQDRADAIIDAVEHADPAITVRAGGDRGFSHSAQHEIGTSLLRAELIAVPIVLILLLLVFGSLVAALLPLAVGLLAIMGSLATLAVLSRLVDVSTYALNLTTALGLGLGIDYALLMVTRFRERLGAGDEVAAAVRLTLRTAGRTVAFSAATVGTALATLLVFPEYFLRSFAYAGIGVVAVAAVAALVVLPALLAVLGHRVNAGRIRRRAIEAHRASARWSGHADRVARYRWPALLGAVAVLLAIAAPLLRINFGMPDDRVLRDSVAARQVGDELRAQFPYADSSAVDVVLAGADDAATRQVAREAAGLPGVTQVQTNLGTVSASGALTGAGDPALAHGGHRWLQVSTSSDPTSSAAQTLVHRLRGLALPAGTSALVGGTAASLVDVKHSIGVHAAIALPIVLVLSSLLLFLLSGSLLQAARALLSTALTLAATLGLMTWIFQSGHLSGLLDFTATPTNLPMTVLLFCVVFGLSMDYEVFVVSRVRELIDAGQPATRAVSLGLARTGRVVTAAAVLMAVSFFAFGVSSVNFLQMFGIGSGFAVLVDATLVRGVVLPAVSAILGERGWRTPRPLAGAFARLQVREVSIEQELDELTPAAVR